VNTDKSRLDTFSFSESSNDSEFAGRLCKRRAEHWCTDASKRYAMGVPTIPENHGFNHPTNRTLFTNELENDQRSVASYPTTYSRTEFVSQFPLDTVEFEREAIPHISIPVHKDVRSSSLKVASDEDEDGLSFSFRGDSDDDEDSISTSKPTVFPVHKDVRSSSIKVASDEDEDGLSFSFRGDSDDDEDSISTSKPTVFVSQFPLDNEQLGRKALPCISTPGHSDDEYFSFRGDSDDDEYSFSITKLTAPCIDTSKGESEDEMVEEMCLSEQNDDPEDRSYRLGSDGQHSMKAAQIVFRNEGKNVLPQDDASNDSEQSYTDVPFNEEEEKHLPQDDASNDSEQSYTDVPFNEEEEKQEATDEANLGIDINNSESDDEVIEEISLSQPNDVESDDRVESNDVSQQGMEAAQVVLLNQRNTFLPLCQARDEDDDSEQTYIDVPMDEEEEKQEAIDEANVLPVVGYDPIRDEENIFVPPLKMKQSLLSEVEISVDADSISLLCMLMSTVLRWFGIEEGTCTFQSSVDRTHNSKSSRISVDYHARGDLQPRMTGRKARRLKVVSLDNFPNIQLLTVSKKDITFRVCMHILDSAYVSDANYIQHNILLTLICALNIAIDGKIPWDGCDRQIASITFDRHAVEWSRLPYFELQDGSIIQKKKIHNCHKGMSLSAAMHFFTRVERVILLLTRSPNVIDQEEQEKDVGAYWSRRQGIMFGGSGKSLSVDQIKLCAGSLCDRTVAVATAAGTKSIFEFKGKDKKWIGPDEAIVAQGDPDILLARYHQFQRAKFSDIKNKLEETFFGMRGDSGIAQHVHSFVDIGLEMRPVDDRYELLPDMRKSKTLVSQLRDHTFPDDVSVASAESDDLEMEDVPPPVVLPVVAAESDELERERGSVPSVESGDLESEEGIENKRDADFVDRHFELKKVTTQISLYNKFCTKHVGNVHTSRIRMNAVSVNSMFFDEERIFLAHPTPGHVRGAQVYSSNQRLGFMHQQRPQMKEIMSIIAHTTNIMQSGRHLTGISVEDSSALVADVIKSMKQIYDHDRDRRKNSKTSSPVRLEMFIAYNNGDQFIGNLPNFDPTVCADLFDKAEVNRFVNEVIDTHLNPCVQLFERMGALLANGERLLLEGLSPALRTRVIGSLEILVQNLADRSLKSFVIQHKLLAVDQGYESGLSVDIPVSVRVSLSDQELSHTSFKYGVMPQLLPLLNLPRVPRKKKVHIRDLDFPSGFPPHHSEFDRAVVRSLSMRLDAGRLENAKAQVKFALHRFSLKLKQIGVVDGGRKIGVMDDVDFEPFLRMTVVSRVNLLKVLARLLVTQYCFNMFKVGVKEEFFGPDPPPLINATGQEMSVNHHFQLFPFIERDVKFYTSQWGSTKFERYTGIFTTIGKCSFCPFPFSVYLLIFLNAFCMGTEQLVQLMFGVTQVVTQVAGGGGSLEE
jgi:hypothetical protein